MTAAWEIFKQQIALLSFNHKRGFFAVIYENQEASAAFLAEIAREQSHLVIQNLGL